MKNKKICLVITVLVLILIFSTVIYAYTSGFTWTDSGGYTKLKFGESGNLADYATDCGYKGRKYNVTVNPNIPIRKDTGAAYSYTGSVAPAYSGNLTFSKWNLTGTKGKDGHYSNGQQVKDLTDTDGVSITATAVWKASVLYSNIYPAANNNKLDVNGYTFNGYILDAETNSDVNVSTSGNYVTGITINPSAIAYSASLTGDWSANHYTVTYVSNEPLSGGPFLNTATNISNSKEVIFNEPYNTNGSLAEPKINGYTFNKWILDNNKSGSNYSDGDTITNNTSVQTWGNHKLVALWTANNYTVTFDYNRPDNSPTEITKNGPDNKQVSYDGLYGTLPVPTMNGYIFDGWYLDNSANTSGYSAGEKIDKDKYVRTYADHTLIAHWTPLYETVIFDYNDGALIEYKNNNTINVNPNSGNVTNTYHSFNETSSRVYDGVEYHVIKNKSVNTKSYQFGSKYGTLPSPALKGWTFKGWYLDNYGSGSAAAQNSVVTPDTSVSTWGTHILRANWKANTYTISYDANLKENENIGTVPSSVVTYDKEEYVLEAEYNNAYTKEYKVFYETNGGSLIDSSGTDTSSWKISGWLFDKTNTGFDEDNSPKAYYKGDNFKTSLFRTSYNPVYNNIIEDKKIYKDNNGYRIEKNLFANSYVWISINDTSRDVILRNLSDEDKSTVTLFATWSPQYITLPDVARDNSEFIGWFTVPQNDPSAYGNIGDTSAVYSNVYVGQPGDKFAVNKSDTTLYAWYNKKPVFVDIYDGLFWEGQKVTYNELLNLLTIFDAEEDYDYFGSEYREKAQEMIEEYYQAMLENLGMQETGIKEEINKIQNTKVEIYSEEYYRLQALEADYKQELTRLYGKRELLQEEKTAALADLKNVKLNPVITEIQYVDGQKVTDVNEDYVLDTRTSHVGEVKITYEATDNGIMCGSTKLNPITMNYTRSCEIKFNYNPLLQLQSIINYNTAEPLEDNSFSKYIISMQASMDSEDFRDNTPWWSKTSKRVEAKYQLFNDNNLNTIRKLQNSIVVTGISDISFNSAFYYEIDSDGNYKNKAACDELIEKYISPEQETLGSSSDDNGVFNKNSWLDALYAEAKANNLWEGISSIGITFDSCDQWGKYSSDRISQTAKDAGIITNPYPIGSGEDASDYDDLMNYQTEGERTIRFVLIDADTDDALIAANVAEKVRYINTKYLDTIASENYWGLPVNKDRLIEIFNKYKNNDEEVKNVYSGTYRTKINTTSKINIYDYTD